jgi:uncharacterized protein YbjT (DUF2867 family)
VSDDDGAAVLLQRLLGAGVRVVEAVPESGRLERLFAAGVTGTAGAASEPGAAGAGVQP